MASDHPIGLRLEIGGTTFGEADLVSVSHSTRLEGSMIIARAEIQVRLDVAGGKTWDNLADASLFGPEGLIVKGRCTRTVAGESTITIHLQDYTWDLEHTTLGAVATFGLSNQELMYLIPQIGGGFPPPVADGYEPNSESRPFLYAVPLLGLAPTRRGRTIKLGDLGISGGPGDHIFYPIAKQLGLSRKHADWHQGTIKAFGVVRATNLIEAEAAAWARATLTADVLGFAVASGSSRWVNRDASFLLDWDGASAAADIRTSDWILIREVSAAKGWIRRRAPAHDLSRADLEVVSGRVSRVLDQMTPVVTVGSISNVPLEDSQPQSDERILAGIQRALRWWSLGSSRPELEDRFLATWFALETLLNSISYPGVFSGSRAGSKQALDTCVEALDLPSDAASPLQLSASLFKNRLENNEWPLSTKLQLFATSFGLPIDPEDRRLVSMLSRQRSQIVHSGRGAQELSEEQVRRLRHLVERLIAAGAVGYYRESETLEPHDVCISLQAEVDAGAPAATIDGRPAGYSIRLTKVDKDFEWEVRSSGRIYDEDNATLTWGRQ